MWNMNEKFVSVVILAMASSLLLASTALSQPRSIIGGQEDPGHPAVGMVGKEGDDHEYCCTGTLIGSRTVLTAAHCFDTSTNAKFEVGGQVYEGQATLHPSFDKEALPSDHVGDLAIINLNRDVIGIAPTPLCNNGNNISELGVTLVGFGLSDYVLEDFGTKRMTTNTITQSSSTTITSSNKSSQVYLGDSGGPALIATNITECVTGVASYADFYLEGEVIHFRPSGHSDWINQASAENLHWETPRQKVCWIDGGDELWGGGEEKCRLAYHWGCQQHRDQPEDDWRLVCGWK